jgi:transposase InsO family protein
MQPVVGSDMQPVIGSDMQPVVGSDRQPVVGTVKLCIENSADGAECRLPDIGATALTPVLSNGEGVFVATRDSSIKEHQRKLFDLLSVGDRRKALAKQGIVKRFERELSEYRKINIKYPQAIELIKASIKSGELFMEEIEVIYGLSKKSVSISSIHDWQRKLNESEYKYYPISLIESKKGNVGMPSTADDNIRNTIKHMAGSNNDHCGTEIYKEIKKLYPSFRHSLRWVNAIVKDVKDNNLLISMNQGPRTYNDRIMINVSRVNNAYPHEIWESDGHMMNNWVKSPFYRHNEAKFRILVRPVVVVWFDVSSGCVVGWKPSLTEDSETARSSLKMAIEVHGLPGQLRTDNAGAYKNKSNCVEYYTKVGRKRDRERALREVASGKKGMFEMLGVDVHFTQPYNAKSNSIEAFWNFCLSKFEKKFFSYTGTCAATRPERFKGKLAVDIFRKYGAQIPSWNEYWSRFAQHVEEWNNEKRECLEDLEGNVLSPIEYILLSGVSTPKLEPAVINRIMRDPYLQLRRISRGVIDVNGIKYNHPHFLSIDGQTVGIDYDGCCIDEIRITTLDGSFYVESAKALIPGYQIGDDMAAKKEVNYLAKLGKQTYAYLLDCDERDKMQRALTITTDEILEHADRLNARLKYAKQEALANAETFEASPYDFKLETAGRSSSLPSLEEKECSAALTTDIDAKVYEYLESIGEASTTSAASAVAPEEVKKSKNDFEDEYFEYKTRFG